MLLVVFVGLVAGQADLAAMKHPDSLPFASAADRSDYINHVYRPAMARQAAQDRALALAQEELDNAGCYATVAAYMTAGWNGFTSCLKYAWNRANCCGSKAKKAKTVAKKAEAPKKVAEKKGAKRAPKIGRKSVSFVDQANDVEIARLLSE